VTATETSTWQACRHCGTPVRPSESGTYWVDAREWDNCPNRERSHGPDNQPS
jgi:hypothetical protein